MKSLKVKIVAVATMMICGSVMAQSVPTGKDNPAKFPGGIVPGSLNENPGQKYQGLSYPEPQVSIKKESEIPSMSDLMSSSITNKAKQKDEVGEIRRSALTEIATAMGAAAGAASKMKEIKSKLNQEAVKLDNLYDFKKMRLTDGVMLPVVLQSFSNYKKNNDDEIRISDKRFVIDSPAKFVSVYPTWRTYLFFNLPTFDAPPPSMLPKNDAEKAIWDEAVKNGWQRGVDQAERIIEASYARLEKDYMGMDLARILLELKILTPTILAKQNMGVTGGGREMNINDQVFRITDHSSLNPNQKSWSTEYPITGNDDGEYK